MATGTGVLLQGRSLRPLRPQRPGRRAGTSECQCGPGSAKQMAGRSFDLRRLWGALTGGWVVRSGA